MKIGIIAKCRIFEQPEQGQQLFDILLQLQKNKAILFIEESLHLDNQTDSIFRNLIKGQYCFISPVKLFQNVDMVIVFGGDGTLLRAASYVGKKNPPVLAVNCGNVGFLSEVLFANIHKVIGNIFDKNYVVEERSLLHIEIVEGKKKIFHGSALNEMVIHHGRTARLIEFLIQLDGKDFLKSKVDGWIIATTTGSTAHSLSAGGAVVDIDVDAILLTPMNPANLSLRPLVIADKHTLTLKLLTECKDNLQPAVTIDGQQTFTVGTTTIIKIKKNPFPLRLVRFSAQSFLGSLQQKLRW